MNAMLDFAVPALLLSAAALGALLLAPSAPPRVKRWLALLGLAAWITPWPLLTLPGVPALLPSSAPVAEWLGRGIAQVSLVAPAPTAPLEAAGMPQTPAAQLLWLVFLLPGLAWFVLDCAAYHRSVRGWQRESRDGAALCRLLPRCLARRRPRIRLVADSSVAVATGLIRPTVWIGDRLLDDPGLRAVLVHECCHVRRADPQWLMLVMLVRRVYWWNPVVRVLARHAVLWTEASCDERCARLLGKRRYTMTLARLMLDAQQRPALHFAHMLRKPSVNLERLALLGRTYRMGAREWACVGLVVAAGAAAVAQSAAQPRDPRIGDWREITASSSASPIFGDSMEIAAPSSHSAIWRRFEDLGGGMTRVYDSIAPDGTVRSWNDHRCDGRAYPSRDIAGDTQQTLSCRMLDRYSIEYVATQTDGSGRVSRGIERVSRDGETYTVRVTTTDASGRIIETVEREFWRLH